MDKRPSIVVAGSVNVDLIMRVRRVPEPGETLHEGLFSTAAGGKGANQAVTLARLGADVIFVGRVGEDFFGDMVSQSLEEAGVSTDFLIRDKENHTGTVVVLVDSEGQNAMVPDYGANLHLCEEDIERAAEVIRGPDILLLQFEVPEAANRRAVAIAESASVPVIINPAPRTPSDLSILKRASIITPNLAEAVSLAGMTGADIPSNKWQENTARMAGNALLDSGLDNILITMGEAGCLFVSEKQSRSFESFRVKAVDATAAGDCFTASLAYCTAQGKSLDEAVTFASATSAITVSREGAQPSLPTLLEVIDFIKSNKLDILTE